MARHLANGHREFFSVGYYTNAMFCPCPYCVKYQIAGIGPDEFLRHVLEDTDSVIQNIHAKLLGVNPNSKDQHE